MAHWAVLPGLVVTHKETHIEKSKSHNKRREKDTNRVRYPTKDSARGAQCAARRSPTEKRRYRGPGQHARAAARTALRAEVQIAPAASSEPADGELLKQCSFSKRERADEYPVDVQMLPSGPESFLATWESKAEARSIRPPGAVAAATNAYNTAMTATDSYAARVAVEVAKATQGTMGLNRFG